MERYFFLSNFVCTMKNTLNLNRKKMRLPTDLIKIIENYVEAFEIYESLPEVSAIRRLVLDSNKNLMRIATVRR